MREIVLAMYVVLLMCMANVAFGQFHGLRVVSDEGCQQGYDRARYSYPQSIEIAVVKRDGLVSKYDGHRFRHRGESDMDHVVSLYEAHVSGACRWSRAKQARFARDIANIALARPYLNRRIKRHHDAAVWWPERNRCWFARTVVSVKRRYDLSVDYREANALLALLLTCK